MDIALFTKQLIKRTFKVIVRVFSSIFSTLFTNYADVKNSFLELSQSPELALVTCVTDSCVSAYVVLSQGKWSDAAREPRTVRTADREAGGDTSGPGQYWGRQLERTKPANQRPAPDLRDQWEDNGSARPGWSLINTQLLPLDRTTRHSWLHRPGENLQNADKSRLKLTIILTGV